MKNTICNFCKRTIDIDAGYYATGPIRYIGPTQAVSLNELELPQSMKFFEAKDIDICPDCWEKFKAAIASLVNDEFFVHVIVETSGGGGDGIDKLS